MNWFRREVLMQLLLLVFVLSSTSTTPIAAQAKPGCPDSCGNLTIPYPFGTKEGCYLNDDFFINCTDSNKAFLADTNIPIINISLDGHLRVSVRTSYDCYDNFGNLTDWYDNYLVSPGRFLVSSSRNMFTVVGCDTYAYLTTEVGKKYETGCMSKCFAMEDVVNGSCTGIGCCQIFIRKGLKGYSAATYSFDGHKNVTDFNPCGYAFVVEDGYFNFSSLDLQDNHGEYPVVLDWSTGNFTCEVAKENNESYACRENSFCFDSDNGPGYGCKCSIGYEGNPYLPNGCIDVDECNEDSLNQCSKSEYCHNIEGNYTCICPKGYHGDGRKDGNGCIANQPIWAKIMLGTSTGLLLLCFGASWLYWGFRHRRLIKMRENFFEQNGGILLKKELSNEEGKNGKTRIFSEEELKRATNNYHESRILGRGGQGTVYKGILRDNRVVAIKKAKIGDNSQVEQFINEVIVLSQVNHRNVVKLVGCCLETEIPLLVYEFVTNGTLFDHLHKNESLASKLLSSWETRLRIIIDTANALSYLHSDISIPIVHRDIKTTNILLDDLYTAKVSDFGASRMIPADREQLTTLVQGTLGYLDPEYFNTSQLTEKSDVYSFGVVLLEILTGKKAISFEKSEMERNLVNYSISCMKEDRIDEIFDRGVLNETNVEQLKKVAQLAVQCVRVKGEERPTMKEVALELQGLRAMRKHPWVSHGSDLDFEEGESLLAQKSYNYGNDIYNTNSTSDYRSMKKEISLEIENGR
ncbi:putative wall-associated receptor kinase-like 16 [Carica papaya]|uniref:putative wall-associated receptor kinase-like 16 n=1 Tax=Carica papaya TaxID=3649 RepID=UPI000B8C984D|nr:putative wall-associated receptor kinase-like 16 [Carica papaya]